jgi:hypothetical protein
LVGRDVPTKLAHGFQQLLAFRTHNFIFQKKLQKVDEAQGWRNIPIPEMMFQTLQLFLDFSMG